MQLLIIRHGESEADLLRVCEGRADFPLTERGKRQAAAMAEYAAREFRISRIYVSTLTRARQTAEYLADATGAELIPDADLMEFNNGLRAGLPYSIAYERYPQVDDLPPDKALYEQESQNEFRARAEAALGRILAAAGQDETVAVVTHGGMIGQLYGAFLGLPVTGAPRFATGDTGLHLWRIDGDRRTIVTANRTEHAKDL